MLEEEHWEVSEARAMASFFWHKTRIRAIKSSQSHNYAVGIMDVLAGMGGQANSVLTAGIPDWAIVAATSAGIESTIREDPLSFLDHTLCHVLPPDSALRPSFEELCRRLGRNRRYREFLLQVDKLYEAWAEDPTWDILFCPFPASIDVEARALRSLAADELVRWALPRLAEIELAYRDCVLNCRPTGIVAVLCGHKDEAEFPPPIRKSPPVHTILPKRACLEIYRALHSCCSWNNGELPECDSEKALEKVPDDIETIVVRYRDSLRSAGLHVSDVVWDIINFDTDLTKEEFVHGAD